MRIPFRTLVLPAVFLLFVHSSHSAPSRQEATVREALTGDSVRLAGGKVLRYAGVYAPPLQSKIPLVRTYGEEALAFNRGLVEGKTVTVEWDSQIRDDDGNLLGYVYLEDGRFINLELLESGHAKARVAPPNLRYAESFRKAELAARRQKLGLWREEPDNPFIHSEFIGDKNRKIFYLPTSPELERIPEAHLIRFRSRIEAVAAGYRPCAECRRGDEVYD